MLFLKPGAEDSVQMVQQIASFKKLNQTVGIGNVAHAVAGSAHPIWLHVFGEGLAHQQTELNVA